MTTANGTVGFAGNDPDLASRLCSAFEPHGWSLQMVGTPQAYVCRLRMKRAELQQFSVSVELRWLADHLAPLLLEVDCRRRETLELVRDIKRIYGAIPVIVIAAHTDLVHLSVARLDGADAMFPKSDLDLPEVREAVGDAMARVRKWRQLVVRCVGSPAIV